MKDFKRSFPIGFFTFLLISLSSACLAQHWFSGPEPKLLVDGVSIGMSRDNLVAELGTPISEERSQDVHRQLELITYTYRVPYEIEVLIIRDRVHSVTGDSLRFSLGEMTVNCGTSRDEIKMLLAPFSSPETSALDDRTQLTSWRLGAHSLTCFSEDETVLAWIFSGDDI